MAVSTLFDGVNDNIVSNTGNNLTLGAYTFGFLVHLEGITGLDTWFSLDDGGTARFAPYTNGTTFGVEHATGTSANLAAAFADWGGWRLVFLTKATGTAAPRAHIFNGVSWVHSNLDTSIGNPNGAISLLWIGAYATGASDFSDGEIGWVGLWNEDTTDGNCETYANFTTLSSKSNAQFFTGTSLLAGGTMNDSGAGNNDETSRTGATTGVRHLPAWQTNFHTQDLPGVSRTSEYVGTTGNPTEARPTGATTGDLVVSVVATDTNSTIAWSTGWTEIYNTANGTATRLGVAARVLTGGGDDTLAITLAGGSNTNDFACQEHLIPAALHGVTTVATDIALGTAATGTSANPDPPSVSVSSGDYYILAMYAADDDDTSNAYMPASYAGLRLTRSATGTSSCSVGTAFAERTAITSENPGTFTMAASEEWVAGTIAIPPASGSSDATPTPAVVATPVAVLAPTITTSSTPTPATVATPVAVGTPTIVVTALPGVIATPVAIPAPTITTTATPTPAVVTASCGVGTPTITATATVEPTVVATPVAIPAPTITTTTTPTPVAVPTPVAIPAPTLTASALIEPAAVATSVAIPAPTVLTGTVTTPAAVATPVAVLAPTITTTADVAVGLVPTPVAIPTPTIDAGSNATPTPATVATPVAVGAVTITAAALIEPATVATPVAIPAPSVATGTVPTPDTVATPVAVLAPTVTATALVPVGLVQTPVSVPASTVDASTVVSPPMIQAPIALPAPTITSSTTIPAALVALVIAVLDPTITGSDLPIAVLLSTITRRRRPGIVHMQRPEGYDHVRPGAVHVYRPGSVRRHRPTGGT